ncbi:MAG: hypothetical protein R6U84_02305, partial [Candidatus Cloacimonadales bacterium]
QLKITSVKQLFLFGSLVLACPVEFEVRDYSTGVRFCSLIKSSFFPKSATAQNLASQLKIASKQKPTKFIDRLFSLCY